MPSKVHLVGSIPLPSAEAVFTTLSEALPGRVDRMPDGETGERNNFVWFQRETFAAAPRVRRQWDSNLNTVPVPSPSQDEIDAAIAALGELSTTYDTNAIESYKTFKALQDAGKIPSNIKFQVSLPTPLNSLVMIADGYQAPLEPLYEDALLRALRSIESAIPPESLSIQWDMAAEILMLEGSYWPHFKPFFPGPVREGVTERITRLVNAVSPSVDVGLHLCYGDQGHKHFFEPVNMATMVDFANAIQAGARRPITYVHMPVPQSRSDREYFTPLQNLKLSGSLFLGLVHYNDLEGTKQRIAAAIKVLQDIPFGVANECGMGRTPPEQLQSILDISAAVTEPSS